MKNKDNLKVKRPQKKQSAFKDNVKMLIDATKKVFRAKADDSKLVEDQINGIQSKKKASKNTGDAQITFFYTNDKYFTQSDDCEIMKTLKEKYPRFMKDGQTDAELKQTIVAILQDKEFILEVLEFYNLNIQDFFKFMFRLDTTIFKGPFLAKLQKIVYACKYEI